MLELARLLLGVDKFAACGVEKEAEGSSSALCKFAVKGSGLSSVDKLFEAVRIFVEKLVDKGVLVADKFCCVDKFLPVGTFCVDKLPAAVDGFGVDTLFEILTFSRGGSVSLNW